MLYATIYVQCNIFINKEVGREKEFTLIILDSSNGKMLDTSSRALNMGYHAT